MPPRGRLGERPELALSGPAYFPQNGWLTGSLKPCSHVKLVCRERDGHFIFLLSPTNGEGSASTAWSSLTPGYLQVLPSLSLDRLFSSSYRFHAILVSPAYLL